MTQFVPEKLYGDVGDNNNVLAAALLEIFEIFVTGDVYFDLRIDILYAFVEQLSRGLIYNLRPVGVAAFN